MKSTINKTCAQLTLALVFCFSCLSIANDGSQEISEAKEVLNSSIKEKNWKYEVYGEMYKSITQQTPIQFSRFLAGHSSVFLKDDSIKFGIESYQAKEKSQSNVQPKWSLSLGYYYERFNSLKFVFMIRSENFNQSKQRTSIVRAGMYGGTFKFISEEKSIFFDSYYDFFIQNFADKNSLTKSYQKIVAMGSASIRTGWRWNTSLRSVFVDPLMLELRGYESSNHAEAGDPYGVLNLGPRILYYPGKPPIYASFFIARSFNLDFVAKNKIAPTWALFSLGGEF